MSNQALHLLSLSFMPFWLFCSGARRQRAMPSSRIAARWGSRSSCLWCWHGWVAVRHFIIWGALNLGLVYALSADPVADRGWCIGWRASSIRCPVCRLWCCPLAAVSTALPAIFPDAHILSRPASGLFDHSRADGYAGL